MDGGVDLLNNDFVQRWSRRLLRAYGVWAILNLLFYVLMLILASKGTFPGGFQRLSAVLLLGAVASVFLLLLISAVNAFALVGLYKVAFPNCPLPVRCLWYLSIPFPALQVWGYFAATWRTLKQRWIWLLVLSGASLWLAGLLVHGRELPAADWGAYLGFMATAFGLMLVVQGRIFWVLGQVHLTRMGYRLVMSLVGLGLLAFFVPQVLMSQAEQRLTWVYGELEKMGVPRDVEAQQKVYFSGAEPDKDWAKIVDGCGESSSPIAPDVAPVVRLLQVYQVLEQGKLPSEDVAKNFPESNPAVKFLNKLIDQEKLLRYPRNYQIDSITALRTPELYTLRRLAYSCWARGVAALKRGDLTLAEKYWARCGKISDNCTATPDLLISAYVGMAAERRGLDLAQQIMLSGKLSTAQLTQWEKRLQDRQKLYFPRLKRCISGEAIYLLDLAQRGLGQIPTRKYRNWAGAIVFCYIQNDLITGLNILRHVIKVFNAPEWYPTNKDAYSDVGFKALTQLNGMTFTPALMPDWTAFWKSAEKLYAVNDLVQIAAKIAAYQRQNHRLPHNLTELSGPLPRDRFSGKNYQYQLDDSQKHFTLWSGAIKSDKQFGDTVVSTVPAR